MAGWHKTRLRWGMPIKLTDNRQVTCHKCKFPIISGQIYRRDRELYIHSECVRQSEQSVRSTVLPIRELSEARENFHARCVGVNKRFCHACETFKPGPVCAECINGWRNVAKSCNGNPCECKGVSAFIILFPESIQGDKHYLKSLASQEKRQLEGAKAGRKKGEKKARRSETMTNV